VALGVAGLDLFAQGCRKVTIKVRKKKGGFEVKGS